MNDIRSPRFLIGIDLGTTNCAVAYIDLEQADREPHTFLIDQLSGPGEISRHPLLPSFVFLNHDDQFSSEQIQLPWESALLKTICHGKGIVGQWARDLGSKTHSRLVSSAKSWLSHPNVDREQPILPWTDQIDDEQKISPLSASALLLDHLRNAWDYHFPDHPMVQQEVVITIPASFDEMARNLTLNAARMAGLANVRLLEEPLAVFYDFLQNKELKGTPGSKQLLLVVDIGGGTTDFSLLKLEFDEQGLPSAERLCVGDHLMLGGDNIDLALARYTEKQFDEGQKKLRASDLAQLVQQTRVAKETLLAHNDINEYSVTLLGSGSSLIKKKRTVPLARQVVDELIFNGFLLPVSFGELPNQRTGAIVEFGLPYASDPNFIKHISQFLLKHQAVCRNAMDQDEHTLVFPDFVLFNGGLFKSALIREHIHRVIEGWANRDVTCLDNDRPDLSVACGAACYARSRAGLSQMVSAGSARTFYLIIENQEGEETALCILPKSTPEDLWVSLESQTFNLRTGIPVKFKIATSNEDDVPPVGQLRPLDNLHTLPPLVTTVGKATETRDGDILSVKIQARLTSIGTLELVCVDETGQQWAIQFETRFNPDALSGKEEKAAELPSGFEEVQGLIADNFPPGKQKTDLKKLKALRQEIERRLGKRDSWSIVVSRKLVETLLGVKKARKKSAQHERLWLNLTGFAMRPGVGTELDEWLMGELWPLHAQGLTFTTEVQSWSEWWIFWRRISAGLSEEQQMNLLEPVAKYLPPSTLRSRKMMAELKLMSWEHIVQMVGSLENLPVTTKKEIGDHLYQRLANHKKEPVITWWAIGRLGARALFHAPANKVLPVDEVTPWIESTLAQDWKNNPQIAFSACMMSRRTEDRLKDVDDALRKAVTDKLIQSKSPDHWIRMVNESMTLNEKETKQIFGESLPSGLSL